MLKQRLEKKWEKKDSGFFPVLVFYLMIICFKIYFKSCGSFQEFSFNMQKKGLVPIIKELEALKDLC